MCQLLGKIASRTGVAVFSCGNYEKVYLRHNGVVNGWKVVEIGKLVKVKKKETTYHLRVGDVFDGADGDIKVASGFERRDNTIRISRELRDHLKGPGMHDLIMSVTADPVVDSEGNLYGFLLTNIDPDSFLDKIGVKNGNLVTEIDGSRITSALTAIRLLQELKEKDSFTLTVTSGGVESILTVVVP